MKIRFAILLLFFLSQIACTKGEKEKVVKYCSENSQECVRKYYKIAGASAANGESQVASVNEVIGEGQVPSTSVLPASVSDQQIATQAAKIESALSSYKSGTMVPTSAHEKVEVGVTRLPDDILPADGQVIQDTSPLDVEAGNASASVQR